VHVADTFHAYNPDHQVFAKARLDEAYLENLGLTHRLPIWAAAAQTGAPR
jgi:hypothetical protein